MSIAIITRQQNLDGVKAGDAVVATGRISPKGKHFALYLIAKTSAGVPLTSDQIYASIGNVEVRLDGVQACFCDASMLRKIFIAENDIEGVTGSTGATSTLHNGVIPLMYYSSRLDTFDQRALTGLGMLDVGAYQVNVYTKAGAGNVCSQIEMYTDYNPDINVNLGTYRQIMQLTRTISSEGDYDDNQLPTYGNDAALNAIHIQPGLVLKTAAVVSPAAAAIYSPITLNHVTFKKDDRDLLSQIPPFILDTMLFSAYIRPDTPVSEYTSGFWSIRFDTGNSIYNSLSMNGAKNLRLITNWSFTDRLAGNTDQPSNTIITLDHYRKVNG